MILRTLRHLLRRSALLLSALCPVLLSASALPPASEQVFGAPAQQGWANSPWYGWVETTQYPFVKSWPHGWQYISAQDSASVWLYDYALGSWMWTSGSAFPWVYKAGSQAGWMRYVSGTQTPGRWYWHESLNYVKEGTAWGPEVIDGMVKITAAGKSFTMGSPEDEPGRSDDETQHTVSFTRDFYLAQTEVTYGQWTSVRASAPSTYTDLPAGLAGAANYTTANAGNDGTHPVTAVSWWDVVKWCNAKSELEGLTPVYYTDAAFTTVLRTGSSPVYMNSAANGYRLPTEAEWEYACRAGTTTAFYNGPITYTGDSPLDPNLDQIGWYWVNSGSNTHPVGQKLANAWGLYDMSGNVWEWCWDRYASSYGSNADVIDPVGAASGSRRVSRGGGWGYYARSCRSADRNGISGPSYRNSSLGFRPARTPSP